MSFAVRLAADSILVEAGTAMPFSVEVDNRGDVADEYELMIEGIDADWTAVPVPTFAIEPHDTQSEKVLIKPPRESESLAGTYPFVIKVRSLSTGEIKSAQAFLDIKPFHSLSVDVAPKRGVATPFRPQTDFEVTVMNLGNSEHVFQMHGSDVDDACAYEFDPEKIAIGPGQQKQVHMTSQPLKRSLLGGMRVHVLTVSARSTSAPQLIASGQAQLEQRPLTSPGAILVAMLFAVLIWGWIANIPKSPSVDELILERSDIVVGQAARISWRTAYSKKVDVYSNEQLVRSVLDQVGSFDYSPNQAGRYQIRVVARDGKRESSLSRLLTVHEAPEVPKPEIESFTVNPERIVLGGTALITYKVNDAVKTLTLLPLNVTLLPQGKEYEIKPAKEGILTYRLVAANAQGLTTEQTLTIRVVKESQAKIIVFRAEPLAVEPTDGRTKLVWQVANAVRVELNDGEVNEVLEPTGGSVEKIVSRKTQFTLTVYDKEGLVIKQKLTVRVKEEPPPSTDGGNEIKPSEDPAPG